MTTLQRLWNTSRPLTATAVVMLAALGATMVLMAVDQTVILGAPRWLKPAKFAISLAIYLLTLAWVLTYLPEQRRLRATVGWINALVAVVELVIIDLQAARGVTSHFNSATPFDATLFATMGLAILVAWGTLIALTVALFRHRFTDNAFGWALRLGALITVLGQASGGFMTYPSQAQLDAARAGGLRVSGSHTVGGVDGGPGLPLIGWSREHGDIRVAHFVGLHAIQVLPAIAWLLPIASAQRRRRAVFAISAGYLALFAMLLAQALNGHPLVPMIGS